MARLHRPVTRTNPVIRLIWASAGLGAFVLGGCMRAAVPIAATPSARVLPSPTRPSATAEPAVKASPTPTRLPEPTATLGPTPAGGAAELILGVVEREGDGYTYGPIFRYHLVEGRVTRVTAGGYELLGIGPNGARVLARQGAKLAVLDLDGQEVATLTERLFASTGKPAIWIPGTDAIVFLEDGPSGGIVVVVDEASGERRSLERAGFDPRELMPASGNAPLVVLGGPCTSPSVCESAYLVDLPGLEVAPLPDRLRPVVSPGGQYAAYLYEEDDGRRRLALAPAEGSREVRMGVPGDNLLDYVWSPNGRDLLAVALVRSDYSGRWFGARQFVLTAGDWSMVELPQTDTANARGLWSPDGRQVVLAGTEPVDGGFAVTLRRIDLASRTVEVLDPDVDLSRPNYVFVSFLGWLPLR
jgi:hypothetical protein